MPSMRTASQSTSPATGQGHVVPHSAGQDQREIEKPARRTDASARARAPERCRFPRPRAAAEVERAHGAVAHTRSVLARMAAETSTLVLEVFTDMASST